MNKYEHLPLAPYQGADVVQLSMARKTFWEWGKFMFDNNVHFEFKADDENVYIGVIQVEEEENEQT